MDLTRPKLAIIVGPTAVGKSAMAIEIAPGLNAEIVTADSQQVYRYLDIGTSKPNRLQRESVPHHLIDVVDPDEPFNAAIYRRLAAGRIEDIHRRGKQALVCGGTGLYIKALTRGLFPAPLPDSTVRTALLAEAERRGWSALYGRLEQSDPRAARRIHPNDRQRIVRALEILELTDKPMSAWQDEHAFTERRFDTLTIGLERERVALYDAINRRCDDMISAGLIEEVRGIAARGYGLHLPALRSVGYRHMGMVLEGRSTLEAAVDLMKRDTRRLAKRQLTWFRGDSATLWFEPSDRAGIRAAIDSFFEQPGS